MERAEYDQDGPEVINMSIESDEVYQKKRSILMSKFNIHSINHKINDKDSA